MENITLTIDEIHTIREEHSKKTKDMDFDEYKKLLDAEIAPMLLALDCAKKSLQNKRYANLEHTTNDKDFQQQFN